MRWAFFTPREWGKLFRKLIDHLKENKESLEQTGYAKNRFPDNPWLDDLFCNLYPTKLPIAFSEGYLAQVMRSNGDQPQGVLKRGEMTQEPYCYLWTTNGENNFTDCDYFHAPIMQCFSQTQAEKLSYLRPKAWKVQMLLLEGITHAFHQKKPGSLWDTFFQLLYESLTESEAESLFEVGEIYDNQNGKEFARASLVPDIKSSLDSLIELTKIFEGLLHQSENASSLKSVWSMLTKKAERTNPFPDSINWLLRIASDKYISIMNATEVLGHNFGTIQTQIEQQDSCWKESFQRAKKKLLDQRGSYGFILPDYAQNRSLLDVIFKEVEAQIIEQRIEKGEFPKQPGVVDQENIPAQLVRFPKLDDLSWDEVTITLLPSLIVGKKKAKKADYDSDERYLPDRYIPHQLRIEARSITKLYTAREAGLYIEKSDQPTKSWNLLEVLAENKGELTTNSLWESEGNNLKELSKNRKKVEDKYRQQFSELAKLLKTIMNINDNPFEASGDTTGSRKAKFKISFSSK